MKPLGRIQKDILKVYGEKELTYYNGFSEHERMAYSRYIRNHDEIYPPTIWYKEIKKQNSKMEDYVEKLFGSKGLAEFKALEKDDRHHYYVYIYRKKRNLDELATPNQWLKNRDDNRLNMNFTEIAKKLNLDDETIRKIYSEAIQKIKIFIMKNPRFKELEEYL